MAQAAVNVHTLPKSSNERRNARYKARRLVAAFERHGLTVCFDIDSRKILFINDDRGFGGDVTHLLKRFRALDRQIFEGYLIRTGRVQVCLGREPEPLKEAA